MAVMAKPHKIATAMRLDTQLSLICTWWRGARITTVGRGIRLARMCVVVRIMLFEALAHSCDRAFAARNPALQKGSDG